MNPIRSLLIASLLAALATGTALAAFRFNR